MAIYAIVSRMKNSTKITTWVLIVLLIAVAVYFSIRSPHPATESSVTGQETATSTTASTVSSVVGTPATTTTTSLATRAGWKRYSDPEYNFTFEYPATWKIETAFTKNDHGMSHIVTVASDASRKTPISERQEIVSIRVTPATTTTVGGAVEYSMDRTGFVSTANAMTCVSPTYTIGTSLTATKIPFYQLMRAHTGDGTRTEDAVLTNGAALVHVINVSAYPGNKDVAGVLSSFAFTGTTKAVVPTCKPATAATVHANQGLIVQVTSPVSGAIWDSNTTHVVTWKTGSSPVKGNVGLYLLNRVNLRECLLGSAAAQAQTFTVNVTAGQTCAQGGGLTLQPGDYDFYIQYPYNVTDPFATSTGALYGSPENRPIHIEIQNG